MTSRLGWLKNHVTEEIFEAAGEEPFSALDQARIDLHLFFCPRCSEELAKIKSLRGIMSSEFFPPSPDFGKQVMEKIEGETEEFSASRIPGGFSVLGWIVIGGFMFLSLTAVFFSLDFTRLADAQGSSFLLPMGLIIGLVFTGYGAVFIGSHLDEFSTWFKLHNFFK